MHFNFTMEFSNRLIKWYLDNKRSLPWRDTIDPYSIWLSEIMLQQTRVAQGLAYFLSFKTHFPTVLDLAKADEEAVLKLWQGLGYYSRARNLHATAKYIANELDGIFPNNFQDLLKLKGVGDYTAAAIASFCYNQAVPVVDGNVFRVLARYFDIETDIAQPAAKKEFAALAAELLPINDAATFNQAIMEFGALQCVPQNPDCSVCVFNDSCLARKFNKVKQLPVKSKKAKARIRHFNYLVAEDSLGNTQMEKRVEKGIWQNLYDFPLFETENVAAINIVSEKLESEYFNENEIVAVEDFECDIIHKLSHQHLHIKFWKVQVDGNLEDGISVEKLKLLPVPIVIHNFIEKALE